MATRPAKPEIKEIATTGKDIDIFSGYLNRLENPDPVLRTEGQGKGLKLYDEVDRDAHAGSVLQTRYLSVAGLEWQIEPGEGKGQGAKGKRGRPAAVSQEQKVADFVQETLLSCNFSQACQELMQAVLYGFWVSEVMWDYSEGQISIKRIIGKHPRRFSFTMERELRLLSFQNMVEGEAVPERKFIVHQYGSTDNPYGAGLGRSLWWPVWFKKHGIKFWTVFGEKWGAPTGVGKYPPGTNKEDQDKLLSAIDAIQQESGIIVPEGMTIDLLEAKRTGADSYGQYCEYMDKQISKRVLGQTASAEGTPGKLGDETAQQEVRDDIVKADADLLAETFNSSIIPWIVDFTIPDARTYPKLWFKTQSEPDLKVLADRDLILVKEIGVPTPVSYFRDTYGIPEPQEGEELVVVPQAASPFGVQSPALGFQDRSNKPYRTYIKNPCACGHAHNFAQGPEADWVAKYMDALAPTLDNVRADGLDAIEEWLRTLAQPPTDNEFLAQTQQILGDAYRGIDPAIVADTVSELYGWYRLKDLLPGIAEATFGGADLRTVQALSELDQFYLSKFLENPDAVARMNAALTEMYHEGGAGLFGADPEAIAELRNRMGQTLADLEDYEVRRIVDTGVQRARNWGHINQLDGAGVAEIEIVEPTKECDFCKQMDGKVIRVDLAAQEVARQADMTPEEFRDFLRANPPDLSNIEQTVSKGLLPPYHPHCHGRIIKRIK